MNKLVFIALALVGALLLLSTPIEAEEEPNPAKTVVTAKLSDEAEEGGSGVTAFDAYSLFYFGQPKAQCYQCTSPCSAYACCPGAYPQCCYVPGLGCRCCAR